MKHLPLLACAALATAACLAPKHWEEGEAPDGAAIYAGSNCSLCHGSDLAGNSLGPSLADVDEHWTVEKLAAYFEDPALTIERDPRLQMLADEYSAEMPAYDHLFDHHRTVLAEWVIEKAKDM